RARIGVRSHPHTDRNLAHTEGRVPVSTGPTGLFVRVGRAVQRYIWESAPQNGAGVVTMITAEAPLPQRSGISSHKPESDVGSPDRNTRPRLSSFARPSDALTTPWRAHSGIRR